MSSSEVSSAELDKIARKKAKDLRYYYRNRERILAAQMVQRREDPEFQERQRVKEERMAAARAEKEAHKAEKEREKERQREERQAIKEAAAAKKKADTIAKKEKQHQKKEEQQRRRETKIKEKAAALGLSIPPVEKPNLSRGPITI